VAIAKAICHAFNDFVLSLMISNCVSQCLEYFNRFIRYADTKNTPLDIQPNVTPIRKELIFSFSGLLARQLNRSSVQLQ